MAPATFQRLQKKRPQRGGAGAVTVGVTYAEGVGMYPVNAPPRKSFPSRRGDPRSCTRHSWQAAFLAHAIGDRNSRPGPAGTFGYAGGMF